MLRIRIGTRASKLAVAQADSIADLIRQKHPDINIELVTITTAGDHDRFSPLNNIGGTGAFTKKIEDELLRRNIDIAVHSAKDLPSKMTDGLIIGAVPTREAYADACVSRDSISLSQIKSGSIIGTGSPRRKALLLNIRPDLAVKDIRGNVETRLNKLAAGQYDALIMSQAGLKRIGLDDKITELLPSDTFIPAPGQGALIVQISRGNEQLQEVLRPINNDDAYRCLKCERLLLEKLEAGCSAAVGGLARINSDSDLYIKAVVLDKEGKARLETSGESYRPEDDYNMVSSMVERLFDRGAKGLIK
jgi:hydroxymethylbilane synthase